MENKDLEELKAHISAIEELIEKHRTEGDPYLKSLQIAFMYLNSERIYQEKVRKAEQEQRAQEHPPSIADCIAVLDNLHERSRFYPSMFPDYPVEYLSKLIEAEHRALVKSITVLKAAENVRESALWWENIRWRIVEYDKNMPYYPDDYKERLIKADTAAIDSVISVLKSLER